jgi:hypothetical protein
MKFRSGLAAAVVLALSMSAAVAHHSFAMFDSQKTITLEGTIKEFQWTNPHTWIQLLVQDASGKEVEWSIEGGSVNGLARAGWKRTLLKAGDKATVVIHPLKDGNPGGSLVTVTVNGQVIGNDRS